VGIERAQPGPTLACLPAGGRGRRAGPASTLRIVSLRNNPLSDSWVDSPSHIRWRWSEPTAWLARGIERRSMSERFVAKTTSRVQPHICDFYEYIFSPAVWLLNRIYRFLNSPMWGWVDSHIS
jgi:hypothetical protein